MARSTKSTTMTAGEKKGMKKSSNTPGGPGSAARPAVPPPHAPRSRPLVVTLGFTVAFAILSAAGHWYNKIYQVESGFAAQFEAQFARGVVPFKLPDTSSNSSSNKGGSEEISLPLKRVWTGHEGTDNILSILVLFFAPGTYGGFDGPGEAVRVQQAVLLLQLISVIVLQFVEGFRGRNRWTLLSFPSIWAFFYQTSSGMFTFPIWYSVYTLLSHRSSYFFSGSSSGGSTGLAVSDALAKAMFPAMLVLYVVPTALMYLPYADPMLNQDATAFWQATPVYVNLAMWILAFTVFRSSGGGNATSPSSGSYAKHINRPYALALVVGIVTQLGVWAVVLLAPSETYPELTLKNIFIPALDLETVDINTAVLRMFQWDYLGIFASTCLYALLGIYDLQTRYVGSVGGDEAGGSDGGVVVPSLVFVAGVLVLGPGAALAAFGMWRERRIARVVEQDVVKKAE